MVGWDELGKNLSDLDFEQVKDIISIMRQVKNKMLMSSTKIRKLGEIMYRDWLSDWVDLMEKEILRLYNLNKKVDETAESLDNE